MKFGPVAVGDAEGAIVAHAVRRPGLTLKKGDVVDATHIEMLRAAGVGEIVVARLEPGDIGEDEAALALARALAGANLRLDAPFTGRCNLFATRAGVLVIDARALDRINEIDEAVTVATLPPMRAVVEGEMVATVKIIPFAVDGAILASALAIAKDAALRIQEFRPLRVGVVSTLLPGLKPSTVDKTERVLAQRLAPAGARIASSARVAHEAHALGPAIAAAEKDSDLVIVFGASAITDRRDVIPAAIESAGGAIAHFGMPVDPGNLLLLGATCGGKPVIGAPGCARSPKENGFDWVLQRLLAGVPVTAADIRRMGAGGLLMEIVSRPQPREGGAPEDDDADA
ncbi:MAG: molybdopterin-binding protein [Hyphomicrobiales bacterium]|nr:molybdopterin-binding protein [Hyphomicrobiales bacterium]